MITEEGIAEQIDVRSICCTLLPVRTEGLSSKQNQSMRELVLSIKEYGLIQPVTVRPVNSSFEVVAGHRRLRACKILRWKKIPCIIRILSDKVAFEIQLVENIQRERLDPIEEAESFKKYILDYGWGGVSHLAKVISKSEQYVSSRIQMLRLPKEIIVEISQRNLSLSHAMELVNLDEEDQKIMKDAIISEGLTVRDVRDMAGSKKYRQSQEPPDCATSPANKAIAKKIKLFKKSLIVFRMSLANIDGLIDEANTTLSNKERVNLVSALMTYRIQIHSMIDECLKSSNELKRKL